MTFELLTDAVS